MSERKPLAAPKTGRDIDWAEIHRRVNAAREAIERATSPGVEERNRILKQRAAALARQPASGTEEESLEVVTFLLALENYGIETRWVQEVCPLRDITPFPSLPPYALGFLNLRGEILPVVDIKRFFGLPEKGLTDLNKVLVVRSGDLALGILADRVLGVRSIPLKDVQPSLPTLTGIREEYLKGVTAERLVILDAQKVLNDERMLRAADVEM